MILIGIDPGLKSSDTGIAVFKDGRLIHNTFVVSDKKNSFHTAMKNIMLEVNIHIDKHQEMKMVVEKSFYPGKANILHLKTLGVYEYFYGCDYIAPASVKKIIAGHGRASKEEVKQALLRRLKGLEKEYMIDNSEDAVDAVAIGLAYLDKQKDDTV